MLILLNHVGQRLEPSLTSAWRPREHGAASGSLEFGHFEDGFQGAARGLARAIGEEESKKSTRLSVRLTNLVEDAPRERWEARVSGT